MPCALWLIIYLFEGKGQGQSNFRKRPRKKTLTPIDCTAYRDAASSAPSRMARLASSSLANEAPPIR